MSTIVEQTVTLASSSTLVRDPWMRKFLKRVLGCWHPHLSLPFTRGRETYRTCVACGARRKFDPEELKMVGPFYYPAADLNSIYQQRQ